MVRVRNLAVAAAVVMVAAVGLAGCATPATSFQLVGATAATSRAFPGELQLFAGSYTFVADEGTNVDDLRWTVTYGGAFDPGANAVLTVDGQASITPELAAPADHAKRFYQVCLASIANGWLRTCQTYAVGADDVLAGNWTSNGPEALVSGVLDRQFVGWILMYGHLTSPFDSPLASPFLFQAPGDGDVWVELVSPDQVWMDRPDVNGARERTVFTRVADPV